MRLLGYGILFHLPKTPFRSQEKTYLSGTLYNTRDAADVAKSTHDLPQGDKPSGRVQRVIRIVEAEE